MIVVVGNTDKVYTRRPGEINDPGDRVIGRLLAVPGVHVQVAFQPYTIGHAHYGWHCRNFFYCPRINVSRLRPNELSHTDKP